MGAHVEVWGAEGPRLVALEAERVTIGKAEDNDIVLAADKAVSRIHGVLERIGGGWAVRDLGSSNGTYVNGERILNEHVLRHADEVRIGSTRLVYRDQAADYTRTERAAAPPDLTRREREVLLALCRPVLSGAMFTKPASIKEMAAELFVTENAVKQHLGRLYDKFAITGGGEPRPVQLANEAIKRGAVSIADLRSQPAKD